MRQIGSFLNLRRARKEAQAAAKRRGARTDARGAVVINVNNVISRVTPVVPHSLPPLAPPAGRRLTAAASVAAAAAAAAAQGAGTAVQVHTDCD